MPNCLRKNMEAKISKYTHAAGLRCWSFWYASQGWKEYQLVESYIHRSKSKSNIFNYHRFFFSFAYPSCTSNTNNKISGLLLCSARCWLQLLQWKRDMVEVGVIEGEKWCWLDSCIWKMRLTNSSWWCKGTCWRESWWCCNREGWHLSRHTIRTAYLPWPIWQGVNFHSLLHCSFL